MGAVLSSVSLRSLWVRFSSPALYELTDEQLMMNLKDDDQKSFCVLYDRYKAPLNQWISWMTGRKAVAEELTQDVFLKVYQQRNHYRPQSFKSWIYTIARNQARDYLRKKQEWLVEDERSLEVNPVNDIDDIAHELILRQEEAQLRAGIDELSPRVREAFTLWLADEWSFDEIGVMLECSGQAAKNLVHRAKRDLKEWFSAGEF